MTRPIRKAVFPVAGMGSRFLPATKANPKEMLPIVDKPLIQYAAEEAVAAGATELIFITGRNKRSIEDHFDKAYELETELEKRGKEKLLALVQDVLPDNVACIYIRQAEPLGLGHAVLCAKPVVGNDPFAVILADDLIDGGDLNCLQQMAWVHEAHGGASVLAVEPVNPLETDRYGIVKTEPVADRVGRVERIVEKPKPANAPSNLGVVGRYLLSPRIFTLLEQTERGAGGEIQLTDAIAMLLAEEPVMAYQFRGKRYDCGDKLGYLVATVEHALAHPELKESFAEYLGRYVGTRLPR
jgi:UTP--glucose-1-phosphate uridylyltransferase